MTSILGKNNNSYGIECDVVVRYVPYFGIGVYAGKLFEPYTIFQNSIGIPIPDDLRRGNELDLYVEQFNRTHDVLTLGYALLVNHATNFDGYMTAKEFNQRDYYEENKLRYKYHDGDSSDVRYYNKWTLFPGDQIFIQYGDDWFSSRGLEETSVRQTLNRDLIHIDDVHNEVGRIPGCASLLTKFENNKLVAAVDIKQGEYIEVVRALLIPEEERFFSSGPIREFVWRKKEAKKIDEVKYDYLYTTRINSHVEAYNPFEPYYLVLLGHGLLYGDNDNGDKIPNVNYDWWSLSMIGIDDTDEFSASESKESDRYCNSSYPSGIERNYPEDINESTKFCIKSFRRTIYGPPCATRMFVSFVANRNIIAGEELVIDLEVDEYGFRYASHNFASQCL
eukprot:gene10945-14697_t